jgi:hypothetical protein
MHHCSKSSVEDQDGTNTNKERTSEYLQGVVQLQVLRFSLGVIEDSILVMQCIIPEEWNPLVMQSLRQGGEPHVGNSISKE